MINWQEQAAKAQQSIVKGIEAIFPYEGRVNRLEAKKIWIEQVEEASTDYAMQKKVKGAGRTMAAPVYGAFRLVDKDTGKVIDKTNKIKVASVPIPTTRNSYIVNGSEYQVPNQLRLRPGVYTRVGNDGDLQAQVNLAKGKNFKIYLNPKNWIFYMKVDTANVMLYHILTAFGVSSTQIKNAWGDEIAKVNSAKSSQDAELKKLHKSLIGKEMPADQAAIIAELTDYLNRTEIDKETTSTTLGKSYSSINTDLLLRTTGKLLGILRGKEKTDDRDSLEFKEVLSVDDFLGERIAKKAHVIKGKLRNNIDRQTEIKRILVPGIFGQHIDSFFTSGETGLSSTPEQTNPLHMIQESDKAVLTGMGGITNEHAITTEARAVHPSSLGFIDAVNTPESSRIGTTLHLALGATKSGRKLQTTLVDIKTGKTVKLTAGQASKATISFRDQYDLKRGKLKAKTTKVKASTGGTIKMVPARKVQYVFPTSQAAFDVSTNMLPFLPANQGNRAMMAAKQLAQALPLVNREAPNVQVVSEEGRTFESAVGRGFSHKAPANGIVSRVTDDAIHVKGADGKSHKVPTYKNYPLNSKTGFIDSEHKVKVGDKVKKGQLLSDTNFTANGELALGVNAKVAYISHKGWNFEDGTTISESFASKATSLHMYKLHADVDKETVLELKKFRAYYPDAVNLGMSSKLDETGVIKKGQKVRMGDMVIAVLRREATSPEDVIMSRIHKAFVKPYKNRSIVWDEEDEGEVVEVVRTPKKVEVHIRTSEKVKVGDKFSSRSANKGTVTRIFPDAEMPRTTDGKVIDVALNPTSIPSRINPSQLLETTAGKVAEKTGKKFIVRNFSGEDYLDSVERSAKKAGVVDKEDLYDPNSGETIPGVNVGSQYMLKLDHPTRKKFSARAQGPGYTSELQPTRGKATGGQALDQLTLYSMMALGAKANLREMSGLKSEKNDEAWRALQTGQALPAPRTTFAFEKFTDMLRGAGVNVTKNGNELALGPLTDKQVSEMSKGEIKNSMVVRGKDLKPEKGGLFDPEITGGVAGENWAHISLAEPMPNPVFENAIKALLDMRQAMFDDIVGGKRYVDKQGNMHVKAGEGRVTGGPAIKILLGKVNMKALAQQLETLATKKKGADLDKINKKLRYIKALQENKLKPTDYVVTKVPVIPARLRPVYGLADGSLDVTEVNHLYRDLIEVNNHQKDFNKMGLPDEDKAKLRENTYKGMKAVAGLHPSIDGRNRRGLIEQIKGPRNKEGFFQNRIMSRRQEFSGRSTITPDPELGLDEVAIPEAMAWKSYQPFVVRELVRQGYSPLDAREQMEKKTPLAQKALQVAMQDRPVMLNRAPSLHKFNVMSFNPQLTKGKAVKINPLIVKGFNADFDGDCQHGIVILRLTPAVMCDIIETPEMGRTWIEERRMAARFEVSLPKANDDGEVFVVNLEDFPHGDIERISQGQHGNNIAWYKAIPGTRIIAYDEVAKRLEWKDVSHYSKHFGCPVEIVNLQSGRQIITDDDPRAVYGVECGSIDMVRNTPARALETAMLVPRAAKLNLTGLDPIDECKIANASSRSGTQQVVENLLLDASLGYFIGAMAGDGWAAPVQVCLASIEESIANRVDACVQAIMEGPVKRTVIVGKDSYGKSTKHTWSSKNLSMVVKDWVGHGADHKHLPPFFLNSPKDFREGLFAGLMDTDGSICVVKAKAKKHPQLQGNYQSNSLRLIQEVRLLASSLGVDGRITAAKTPAGKQCWMLSFSNKDIKRWGGKDMMHPAKLEKLASIELTENNMAARIDQVPITPELAVFMRKKFTMPRNEPSKQKISDYTALNNSRKRGHLGRIVAKRIPNYIGLDAIFEHEDGRRWWNIVLNDSVKWDKVVSVEKTDIVEDGYDLAVPGHETFMAVDGVILSNTMAVHIPISEEARQESFDMLPSNNLWGPRMGELMHHPSLEAVAGLYMHTTTKKGRDEINALLPKGFKVTKAMTEKGMMKLLSDIGRKSKPEFIRVVNKLKNIGNRESFRRGLTIGLEDLKMDQKAKARIIGEAEKEAKKGGNTDAAVVNAYMKASKKLDKFIATDPKLKANGFRIMMDSGAKGNNSQIRQILAAPMLVQDISGRTVPVPITKAYAQGLDMGDYWASMSGARKGMIDRALQTAEPGALAKEILNSTVSEVVGMPDCGTLKGVDILLTDPEITDRYLAKNMVGVGRRNELITHMMIKKAKRKRLKSLSARSPLTCRAAQGVCQKCYGIDEKGRAPDIGTNVGVVAGQAISERATQLTMRTFHTGAAAGGGGGGITAGFQRVKELMEMPKKLKNQATLATVDGRVTAVRSSPIGGWDVFVGMSKHHIPKSRRLLVKRGDAVKKGQSLSDGSISPQELLELRGMRSTQDYLVNQIVGEYGSQGVRIKKKLVETAIRPLTNRVVVTNTGGHPTLVTGDNTTAGMVEDWNEQQLDPMNQISFEPMLRGINTRPLVTQDWLSRLNFQKLKDTIQEGAGQGWKSDVASPYAPLASYAYGPMVGFEKF